MAGVPILQNVPDAPRPPQKVGPFEVAVPLVDATTAEKARAAARKRVESKRGKAPPAPSRPSTSPLLVALVLWWVLG